MSLSLIFLFQELDANTFASWGIDMLKVDGCNADSVDYHWMYPLLGHYLNRTGRPITYECSWPAYIVCAVLGGSALAVM